jgi:hypothetical protein
MIAARVLRCHLMAVRIYDVWAHDGRIRPGDPVAGNKAISPPRSVGLSRAQVGIDCQHVAKDR